MGLTLRPWIPLVAALAALLARADDSPAEWAPSDALVFVGVPDVALLQRQLDQSPAFRLMRDPAARELLAQAPIGPRLFESLRARLSLALDVPEADLRNPLGGPLCLFLAPPSDDAGAPEPVLVARVTDPALMRQYYQRLLARFRAASDSHESVPFRTFSIEVFSQHRPPPADEDSVVAELHGLERSQSPAWLEPLLTPDALLPRLAVCLADDRLVVALSAARVRAALLQDRPGSLARGDLCAALRARVQPGEVEFVVHVPAMLAMTQRRAGAEARRIADLLGLGCVRGAIGTLRVSAGDSAPVLDALILTTGERQGLAALLSCDNQPLDDMLRSSPDALVHGAVNADPARMLADYERMLRGYDGAAADALHAAFGSVALPDGTVLDVRNDLFGALRAPLRFTLQPSPRPGAPPAPLVEIGVADRAALTRLLEALRAIVPMSARDLGAAALYELSLGRLALAVSDERLLIGETSAVASRAGRARVGGATSGPATSGATPPATAPTDDEEQVCFALFVDAKRVFEAAMEFAPRRETLLAGADPAALLALALVEHLSLDVKPGRWSEARRLAAYRSPALLTVANRPEGFRVRLTRSPNDRQN